MNSRKVKQCAKDFRKEFGFKQFSSSDLCGVLESQGYTVIRFNHIFNDGNVAALIDALKLTDNVVRAKGFTYSDSNYRIVFIHEDLSEKEKTMVLAHELGHIYLGHMSSVPIIGRDVIEEYEANEFAHYLLNADCMQKLRFYYYSHRRMIYLLAVAILLIAIIAIAVAVVNNRSQFYGDYYITESGNKYHIEGCAYVNGKTNTHRLTTEEFESGMYEPCKMCITGK